MKVYQKGLAKLETEEIDGDHEGRLAYWLCRLFPEEHQNLILGYYSLLLHNGNSPLDAAIKTMEIMGPTQIQNTERVVEVIRSLKEQIDHWLGIMGEKYKWF